MQNQLVTVLFISLTLLLGSACGPTCPEAKTALSTEIMAYDDATRVNKFVQKRKDTIATVEAGNIEKFDMDKYKFTVTACELAIQVQLRIINLTKQKDMDVLKNQDRINETRCLFDKILDKAILPNITMADGQKIQDEHAFYKLTFGKNGEFSSREYQEYYKQGVKAEKPAELIEQEKAALAGKGAGKTQQKEADKPKPEEKKTEAEIFASDDEVVR